MIYLSGSSLPQGESLTQQRCAPLEFRAVFRLQLCEVCANDTIWHGAVIDERIKHGSQCAARFGRYKSDGGRRRPRRAFNENICGLRAQPERGAPLRGARGADQRPDGPYPARIVAPCQISWESATGLAAVPRAVDRQGFEMPVQDLFGDDAADVRAAIHRRYEVLGTRDMRPIDLAIAAEHAHALIAGKCQVHLSDGPEERFVDRALPHFRTAGIPPDGRELIARHRRAVQYEAIEQVLMNGVGRLYDDDAYGAREGGMPDEGDAKIGVELASVILSEADAVGSFPRREYALDHAGIS